MAKGFKMSEMDQSNNKDGDSLSPEQMRAKRRPKIVACAHRMWGNDVGAFDDACISEGDEENSVSDESATFEEPYEDDLDD